MRSLSDLAWRLRTAGVPHGDLAGVCRDRGLHLFTSVWGDCLSDASADQLFEALKGEHEQRQRDYLDAVAAEPPAPLLQDPTPAEQVRLLGGAEHASRVLTDPAKLGLIRIASLEELDDDRRRYAKYLQPGPTGPIPENRPVIDRRPPARAPLPREWIDDGRTFYPDGTPVT